MYNIILFVPSPDMILLHYVNMQPTSASVWFEVVDFYIVLQNTAAFLIVVDSIHMAPCIASTPGLPHVILKPRPSPFFQCLPPTHD